MGQYTEDICRYLAPAKVFSDSDGHNVTSIDIIPDGSLVVTSSEDEALRLYECSESGSLVKTLFARKYGVALVRFMHEPGHVTCASSNNWDYSLRYWNADANRYVRYFKGHRARVTGLEVSPADGTFLSAAADGAVRIWDVRSDACAGFLRVPERGVRANVALDDRGIVFAVSTHKDKIKLYDARNHDKGPFNTFNTPSDEAGTCLSIKFNSDGKYLMLAGGSDHVLVLDAFTGALLRTYRASAPNVLINDAVLTPDGHFVIGGSHEGGLHIWSSALPAPGGDASERVVTEEVAVRRDCHVGPVHAVRASPTTLMVATACKNLTLWIPDLLPPRPAAYS